jgi:hypothetical protein
MAPRAGYRTIGGCTVDCCAPASCSVLSQMRDCTRVLKLLDGFSLPTRIGVPQTPEVHIDIAAALVRGGATSAALGYLHPTHEQLSRQAQQRADAVLWDELNPFDFDL